MSRKRFIGVGAVSTATVILILSLGFSETPKPVEISGRQVFVGFTHSDEADSQLVTCDQDGVVRFYSKDFRERSKRQIPEAKSVVRFAFSEASDAYCVEMANGEVVFGRFSTCEVQKREKVEFLYDRIAFTNDGRFLSMTSGGPMRLLRVAEFVDVKVPDALLEEKHNVATSIAVTRLGGNDIVVAANFLDDSIESYVLETSNQLPPLRSENPKDKKFVDLVTDPEETFVAAASMTSALVWDLQTRHLIARLPEFDTSIGNRLAISGDGKTLVYAKSLHTDGNHGALRAYRTSDWRRVTEIIFNTISTQGEAELNQVLSVSVSYNGGLAATLHGNGTVRVWRLFANSKSRQ